MFASLSPGRCWKCGAQLMDLTRRNNARLRSTIPYDDNSPVVASARTFLQAIRLIRVKQDSCPGTGHFAACRAAVDSMVRLGFTGTIEVIHLGDNDSLTNMPLCYDQFAAGGLDVTGPAGNQVRINYVQMGNIHLLGLMQGIQATRQFFQMRPRAMLGVYGASDGHGTENDALPLTSPANDLNTRCAAVLQPFAWNQMRMVEDRDGHYREQILRHSLASYVIEVPDLIARLPRYQRDQTRLLRVFQAYCTANAGATAPAVVATVAAALAKVASGGAYLLPVYGLHANYPGTWTLNSLVRAVRGLRTMGVLDGPVIIFNIRGGYDPDMETSGLCTPLRADQLRTERDLLDAVDGVFVVRAPGLPTALFQQLAANATLPMLLEGANTANLCFQLGTPFLAVSNNASIPTLDEDDARGHVALRALTAFLWGANRASDDQIDQLIIAIADALTPSSELARYFLRLHQIVRAPDGDQLAFALARLERNIRLHGPALPVVPPIAAPIRILRLRPPPEPPPPRTQIFRCPSCRGFASSGPGTCLRCGTRLQAQA